MTTQSRTCVLLITSTAGMQLMEKKAFHEYYRRNILSVLQCVLFMDSASFSLSSLFSLFYECFRCWGTGKDVIMPQTIPALGTNTAANAEFYGDSGFDTLCEGSIASVWNFGILLLSKTKIVLRVIELRKNDGAYLFNTEVLFLMGVEKNQEWGLWINGHIWLLFLNF